MAGLLALLTILSAVPDRLEGRGLQVELPPTSQALERATAGVWVAPAEAIRQLLDLVKQGVGGWDWGGDTVLCYLTTRAVHPVAALCRVHQHQHLRCLRRPPSPPWCRRRLQPPGCLRCGAPDA